MRITNFKRGGVFDNVFTILIILILLSSLLFLIYYLPSIPIGGEAVEELNGQKLVDSLRGNGGYALASGKVAEQFFSVPGRIYTFENEQIIIFEYDSSSAAKNDIAIVSENGSTIGNKKYAWQGAPHFFQSGKVIVLYVGSSQRIHALLSYVLGQPVAGSVVTFTTVCSVTQPCSDNKTCVSFVGDTLCLSVDPCILCGKGQTCKKLEKYPIEVICSK